MISTRFLQSQVFKHLNFFRLLTVAVNQNKIENLKLGLKITLWQVTWTEISNHVVFNSHVKVLHKTVGNQTLNRLSRIGKKLSLNPSEQDGVKSFQFQSLVVPSRNTWGNVNRPNPRGKNRPNRHWNPWNKRARAAKVCIFKSHHVCTHFKFV